MKTILKIFKEIQDILKNNLRVNKGVDEYTLCLNKHIPHGDTALMNKFFKLEKLVMKYGGKINILSKEYLSSDSRCIDIYIRMKGEAKTIFCYVR